MDVSYGCATYWGVYRKSILVFAHSPRLLAVAVRSNLVSADVVVTQAPCEESPDAPQHWQMLRRLIAGRARQDVPLLMFVDANGTSGCETSSAVGPTRADPQTDNGTRLHEALLQAGLAAATTFWQSDTSSCGATWWSAIPGARPRRIDFVAVRHVGRR